jgi:hypothetical protein
MPVVKHYLFRRWTNLNYDVKWFQVDCDWQRGEFWDFVDYIESTIGYQPTKQHKLIRIQPNKGWIKKNIKWATATEAGLSLSTAHIYRIGNKKNNIIGWARTYNLVPRLVYERLNAGWPIEKALELK